MKHLWPRKNTVQSLVRRTVLYGRDMWRPHGTIGWQTCAPPAPRWRSGDRCHRMKTFILVAKRVNEPFWACAVLCMTPLCWVIRQMHTILHANERLCAPPAPRQTSHWRRYEMQTFNWIQPSVNGTMWASPEVHGVAWVDMRSYP